MGLTWIFGRKAFGLRSRMASIAAWRTISLSLLLQQLTQLQPSQYRPDAKHSQYSFRQREFLQLQCFFVGAAWLVLPPPRLPFWPPLCAGCLHHVRTQLESNSQPSKHFSCNAAAV
jgi:hypothetical protein